MTMIATSDLYAHYTNARVGHLATLRITFDVAGRDVFATISVEGKRDARQRCKREGWKPWNF